ncbi:SpoIIE family protein phosphatase [[Phormidium] sp. ETS-05]|uniref:SpoIIE family protein phosphatase n=1 Tax=[Phormidium] sp. ETS-05 TaxID=222819 RepID=UPI001E3520F3|nr:SpoIIE family protein phosphatase [[Phormidium] sp. ETS-05]
MRKPLDDYDDIRSWLGAIALLASVCQGAVARVRLALERLCHSKGGRGDGGQKARKQGGRGEISQAHKRTSAPRQLVSSSRSAPLSSGLKPNYEHLMLQQAHDLIAIFSLPEARLLHTNDAWRETVGQTSTATTFPPGWDNILHPNCPPEGRDIPAAVARGQTFSDIELVLVATSGAPVWVRGKVISHEENGQNYLAAIFRNISTEKQLAAKYQQLFEQATEGIFEASLSGDFLCVNPALARIYGYETAAEFLADIPNVSQLYLEIPQWQDSLPILEGTGELSREVKVKRRGGHTIWVLEKLQLQRDDLGRPAGVQGFVQDITTRRQAEATLAVAKEQLQAVLDAVPGTVSLISSDFRYLGVNRHLAATYNLPLDFFVGREVGFRQSAFGQFVREFFTNAAEEAAQEIDTEINGSFRSDLVIAKKWLDSEAAVFVGIDITERKRAEAALRQELAEAAEYVRSLLPAPISEPIAIDSRFIPSQQLGGDGFDYYWLDEDHLAIYLLDVSGHGSRAALLSVSVLNFLRSRFLPDTNFYQPERVLSALNQIIQMERQRNMYFTIWYGVYNQRTRELVYASAGHPPAVLLSHSPFGIEAKLLKTSGCLPIGMFPTAQYTRDSSQIQPQSTLYIFSDGIYEIRQPDGTIWDLEDFLNLLENCHRHGDDFSLERVLQAVRAVNTKDTFNDDVSLLQINFKP